MKKNKRETKIERSQEKTLSEISDEAIDQKKSQTTSKKSLFKDKKGLKSISIIGEYQDTPTKVTPSAIDNNMSPHFGEFDSN